MGDVRARCRLAIEISQKPIGVLDEVPDEMYPFHRNRKSEFSDQASISYKINTYINTLLQAKPIWDAVPLKDQAVVSFLPACELVLEKHRSEIAATVLKNSC